MYQDILVHEARSDKSCNEFDDGVCEKVNIRDNILNKIILNALAKGQSRLEAYEDMVNNVWANKTLQDMHKTIKFTPDIVHQGTWIPKVAKKAKKSNR